MSTYSHTGSCNGPGCYLCHLYHTNTKYRNYWDNRRRAECDDSAPSLACTCNSYHQIYKKGDCSVCWEREIGSKWSKSAETQAVQAKTHQTVPLQCIHFDSEPYEPPGKRTGKDGNVCGCVSQWLYSCDIHEKCVRTAKFARENVACCETCPDFTTERLD